jgi:hypothetical protein
MFAIDTNYNSQTILVEVLVNPATPEVISYQTTSINLLTFTGVEDLVYQINFTTEGVVVWDEFDINLLTTGNHFLNYTFYPTDDINYTTYRGAAEFGIYEELDDFTVSLYLNQPKVGHKLKPGVDFLAVAYFTVDGSAFQVHVSDLVEIDYQNGLDYVTLDTQEIEFSYGGRSHKISVEPLLELIDFNENMFSYIGPETYQYGFVLTAEHFELEEAYGGEIEIWYQDIMEVGTSIEIRAGLYFNPANSEFYDEGSNFYFEFVLTLLLQLEISQVTINGVPYSVTSTNQTIKIETDSADLSVVVEHTSSHEVTFNNFSFNQSLESGVELNYTLERYDGYFYIIVEDSDGNELQRITLQLLDERYVKEIGYTDVEGIESIAQENLSGRFIDSWYISTKNFIKSLTVELKEGYTYELFLNDSEEFDYNEIQHGENIITLGIYKDGNLVNSREIYLDFELDLNRFALNGDYFGVNQNYGTGEYFVTGNFELPVEITSDEPEFSLEMYSVDGEKIEGPITLAEGKNNYLIRVVFNDEDISRQVYIPFYFYNTAVRLSEYISDIKFENDRSIYNFYDVGVFSNIYQAIPVNISLETILNGLEIELYEDYLYGAEKFIEDNKIYVRLTELASGEVIKIFELGIIFDGDLDDNTNIIHNSYLIEGTIENEVWIYEDTTVYIYLGESIHFKPQNTYAELMITSYDEGIYIEEFDDGEYAITFTLQGTFNFDFTIVATDGTTRSFTITFEVEKANPLLSIIFENDTELILEITATGTKLGDFIMYDFKENQSDEYRAEAYLRAFLPLEELDEYVENGSISVEIASYYTDNYLLINQTKHYDFVQTQLQLLTEDGMQYISFEYVILEFSDDEDQLLKIVLQICFVSPELVMTVWGNDQADEKSLYCLGVDLFGDFELGSIEQDILHIVDLKGKVDIVMIDEVKHASINTQIEEGWFAVDIYTGTYYEGGLNTLLVFPEGLSPIGEELVLMLLVNLSLEQFEQLTENEQAELLERGLVQLYFVLVLV